MVLSYFQCWGILLTRITVGQGHFMLAVAVCGYCLNIFSLLPSQRAHNIETTSCRIERHVDVVCLLGYVFSFSLFLGDGPVYTEILFKRAVLPRTTNQHDCYLQHRFVSECPYSPCTFYCNTLSYPDCLHHFSLS